MGLVFVFPRLFLLSLWCQGGSSSSLMDELRALFCALSSFYCYYSILLTPVRAFCQLFRVVWVVFFIDVDIRRPGGTITTYLHSRHGGKSKPVAAISFVVEQGVLCVIQVACSYSLQTRSII